MSTFRTTLLQVLVACLILLHCTTHAFSTPSSPDDARPANTVALFDRFRHHSPANMDCIRQFDASLIQQEQQVKDGSKTASTWVAVYRSNHNKPSVFIKDDFLNAMRMATSVTTDLDTTTSSSSTTTSSSSPMIRSESLSKERPVAVARLKESSDYPGSWVLDSMRCLLKKEDTNSDCDGGSEHTEALSVAIDALLLHHLSHHKDRFEQAIRTKATLVSGVLVEDRGFREVDVLAKDFATHVSSMDACMEAYADRVVSAKHPSARNRALQIVSLLGSIDRDADMKAAQEEQDRQVEDKHSDDDKDDNDPWAAIKQYL